MYSSPSAFNTSKTIHEALTPNSNCIGDLLGILDCKGIGSDLNTVRWCQANLA